MLSDGTKTHGFCRRISSPSQTHAYVACILTPWPWFQAFHHATDVAAFLLSATIQASAKTSPPALLPSSSQAHTFLTSLHAVTSTRPSAGSILQIPLPHRDDYPFAPVQPIAIAPPGSSIKTPPLPPVRTGPDFTLVQVPPQPPGLSAADPSHIVAPLAALVHALPPAVLANLIAAVLTERSCVLTSDSPARASTAAAAAATITAPMHWRAALLPLVPPDRLHLLDGPQAVIAGLPTSQRGNDGMPPPPPSGGRLVIDLDTGAMQPALGSTGCFSKLLPGWQRLCCDLEDLKARVPSAHDYTCNAAITATMHTFLAATIGSFRDHVKPPPKAGRLGRSGTSRLSSRLFRALSAPIRFASDVSGRLRSGRSGRTTRGAAAADEAPVAMFMPEDNIIYGTGGWRFHHDQFAAALATPEHRALADTLIHTKLWTKFIEDRMALMCLPSRAGRTDAFELRVLAHLSSQKDRAKQPSTQVALVTHRPRARLFGLGGPSPHKGGRKNFDPYDPYDASEDTESEEEEEAAAAYATASLQPRAATTSLIGGGASTRLGGGGASTRLAGSATARLAGASARLAGGGATARLTGSTAPVSAGSADYISGNAMRKLGDISHEQAQSASLRTPQLLAGMQPTRPAGTSARPASGPAPTHAVAPGPADGPAFSAALGGVAGHGSLAQTSTGSVRQALTSGGYMPDC